MKAAVRATPPSGMQPSARATPTPPPGYVTRTLPPLGPPSRPPLPMARLAREVALTKATLAGVCMAAFSCGIVCSVAIYRFAAFDCARILIDAIGRAIRQNGGGIPTRTQVVDAILSGATLREEARA